MEKTPGIILEDLLMIADWKLKQTDYKSATTNYFMAYQMATGTFANLEYDGTTMENAAKMGMIAINPQSTINNLQLNDGSYCAAELALKLYIAATNDKQRAEYDTEAAINVLPVAYKGKLNYYYNRMILFNKLNKCSEIIKCGKQYYGSKSVMPEDINLLYWSAYLSLENFTNAFEVCLNQATYDTKNFNYTRKMWYYANESQFKKFIKIVKVHKLIYILKCRTIATAIPGFLAGIDYINEIKNLNAEIKNNISQNKLEKALNILQKAQKYNQPGLLFEKSNVFLSLGKTNEAFDTMICAYKKRMGLIYLNGINYPSTESDYLKNLYPHVN